MFQLRVLEGGTAECAEHAERHTYRRRLVPPRVPRGIRPRLRPYVHQELFIETEGLFVLLDYAS